MDYTKQIENLVKSSKRVISGCVFPGGAIVAANSFHTDFPKDAKNYKFVWPRDGAFICYASEILGLNIADGFYNWCMKAEGWEQKGLFFEKYFISGKQAAPNFQPDQTGTLLWALCQSMKDKTARVKKFERLVVKSANALCKIWDKRSFNMVSQDLWEERLCFPDLGENFTYSLAACHKGLMEAYAVYGIEKWKESAGDMKTCLLEAVDNIPVRSFGLHTDNRLDASLMGLIWPFNMPLPDNMAQGLIKALGATLVRDKGMYRYEHDEYDGWMYNKNIHRRKGSGYWPLLNFWLSTVLAETGKRKEAETYFYKVLDDLPGTDIPEQIFNNNYQVSVSPLGWSHAMFVIAAHKLGLLEGPGKLAPDI